MKKIALAALAAVAVASAADATFVTQIWTGTVSGTDGANFFGGGDLTGQTFIVAYEYDTNLGNHSEGSSYSYTFGGRALQLVSPNLSASITIAGHTVSYVADELSSIRISQSLTGSYVYDDAFTLTLGLTNRISSSTNPDFGKADFSFSGDVSNADSYGYFHNYGDLTNGETALTLTNETLTQFLPFVPEPATWAMFISGFGMIGAAMRRKKVTLSFA